MGLYTGGQFDIELTDTDPYAAKPYKCPEADAQFLAKEVQQLMDIGIAEPTISPWAFPSICVHRYLHGVDKRRMVVDFRELNRRTVADAYPMPDCDSILARLQAKRYYATLDIKSGFWQVGLSDRAKSVSVFVTRDGQYRFRRMAFGLRNAPAYFQRMMAHVLGELVGQCCLVYIDDVVVWGDTPDQVLASTERVIERLSAAGITLNGAKCCFLSEEIELLGHTVSKGLVKPQTQKLSQLISVAPKTVKDVQLVLGVLGYFRKFVRGFADRTRPILETIRAAERKHTTAKLSAKQRAQQLGRLQVVWTPAAQQAMEELVALLEDQCWVRLPDYSREFILYTDYSGYGIGGALMQTDETGTEWPVCMVSRALSPTEQSYAPIEGEALALVWAVDRLRHIIEGRTVVCKTDHKPLVYVFRNSEGKSKLTRWALKLQAFDLQVEYVRGKANTIADFASRVPAADLPGLIGEQAFDLAEAIPPSFHVYAALEEWRDDFNRRLASRACPQCGIASDSDGRDPMVVCDRCGDTWHVRCGSSDGLPSRFWFCGPCQQLVRETNERDLVYDTNLLDYLEYGIAPQDGDVCARVQDAARFLRYSSDRGLEIQRDGQWFRVPTPTERRELVEERHVLMRHAGAQQIVSSLRQDYWWKGMLDTALSVIGECDACQKSRARFSGKHASLTPTYKGIGPFQQWSVDSIPSLGGRDTLIVCVDTFSKWVEVYATQSRDAGVVWQGFFDNVIARYGVPRVVRVDQGTEYKGEFDTMCRTWGIQLRRIAVQYPQANGQAERYVQTIKTALLKYLDDFEGDWRPYLSEVLMALRCLVHRSHGFTPFYVVHGFEAEIPSFLLQRDEHDLSQLSDSEMVEYAESLAAYLRSIRDQVVSRQQLYDSRSKAYYDRKVGKGEEAVVYQDGDLVLLRQRKTGGVRLPAQGPYVFRRYRSKHNAEVDNPLTGKRLEVSLAHLLPYKGKAPPIEPATDVGKVVHKRARRDVGLVVGWARSAFDGDELVHEGVTSLLHDPAQWQDICTVLVGQGFDDVWQVLQVIATLRDGLLMGCKLEVVSCPQCHGIQWDQGDLAWTPRARRECTYCGLGYRRRSAVVANPLAALYPRVVDGRVRFGRTVIVDRVLAGGTPAITPWIGGLSEADLGHLLRRFKSAWQCIRVLKGCHRALSRGSELVYIECPQCEHEHVDVGKCEHSLHRCGICGYRWCMPVGQAGSPLAVYGVEIVDDKLHLLKFNPFGQPAKFFCDVI